LPFQTRRRLTGVRTLHGSFGRIRMDYTPRLKPHEHAPPACAKTLVSLRKHVAPETHHRTG